MNFKPGLLDVETSKGTFEAMATKTERLTDLKCRDYLHYKLTGWWDPQRVCEIGGFPVDKDGPACISVLPKNTK